MRLRRNGKTVRRRCCSQPAECDTDRAGKVSGNSDHSADHAGCLLFYPIVTSIYGRVIWESLICTYIGFFLFGLVCAALGIFISSLTEMPLIAILISELAMLLLLLMDNAAQTAYLSSIPILSDVLDWFSNQTKFYVFSQGLLQISDLLGYVTEILVFLIWTIISVEKDAGAGGKHS